MAKNNDKHIITGRRTESIDAATESIDAASGALCGISTISSHIINKLSTRLVIQVHLFKNASTLHFLLH